MVILMGFWSYVWDNFRIWVFNSILSIEISLVNESRVLFNGGRGVIMDFKLLDSWAVGRDSIAISVSLSRFIDRLNSLEGLNLFQSLRIGLLLD